MNRPTHGGDIETAKAVSGLTELLDFSANVNPLGMPEGVQSAASQAAQAAERYPDPHCRALVSALSAREGVAAGHLLCGSGAADLIFRLALALRPRTALLPAPTFSEYEQALRVAGCAVRRHLLSEADDFALTEAFLEQITPDIELVVLCNPNNPTGQAAPRPLVERILARCEDCGARLLLDECFVDFLDDPARHSLLPLIEGHPRLVILKAFTKIYAMAGLRLGYCLTSDAALLERMAFCGPPWAVSSVAQAAGLAALTEEDYLLRTKALIARERAFLTEQLTALGLRVLGSQANYIFFHAPISDLPERLLPRGVLIRSCANYPGLDAAYCRIAVRTRAENERLLAALAPALSER